jgi:anaerobic selenocysteine-containing dehydrogenase
MSAPTRRSLFRWAALAGAGAGVAACKPPRGEGPFSQALDKPPVPGAERYGTFEERWVNTSCAQCPAGCGIRVRVVEGRAVRIEGNPANPLNRGGIGPRGLAGLQVLYDADRLTGPMRRDGDRLVPVSWTDALATLSSALAGLRAAGRPERLLVWSGAERGMVHELLARFARVYGTPNFVEGTRSAVISQAMEAALGAYTLPAFDWGGARHVLSLGAGLLEDSCQAVYFTRAAAELRRGRGERARIIHAGPIYDLSAHNADEWVQIAPGSVGAFALGLAHVMVRDGTFARDFVRDQTDGFEAFAASLDGFAPAQVAAITGVPEATIERLAAELAGSGAAFAVVDERSVSFSNGVDNAHAALALNALLGAVGRDPAGLFVEQTPPYASWPDAALDATATAGRATPRRDGAGSAGFPSARAIHEHLPDAFAGVAPPEIALLYHVNPAWARAQPARWRDALARIPMIVSFSPFLDETVAEHADLVLPDHTYLERWEDAGAAPGAGRPVAGIRRPVVEPLLDTRATGDVVIALAQAIGAPVAGAFPWSSFAAAMEERFVGLYAAHRGSIDAKGERELIARLYETGFWADLDAAPEPRRFTFHAGWDAPRWDGDPERYPLALIAYRPLGYAEGSGANQPWLRMLQSRPWQEAFTTPAHVHPDDAPGLRDGERVTITSPSGSIEVPIRLDPRMRPGCIAVPLGGGHTAFGRWAEGVGANVMTLLPSRPAPRSGANAICTTRVRLDRGGTR